MESIVIFVLFAVISSVIQAVVKNSNQQKQPAANAQEVKPKEQMIYKTINKTKVPSMNEVIVKSVAPVRKSDTVTSNIDMESERLSEGKQITGSGAIVIPAQKEEIASSDGSAFAENLTYDELQRSIIMAEILGKPRALKKAIR